MVNAPRVYRGPKNRSDLKKTTVAGAEAEPSHDLVYSASTFLVFPKLIGPRNRI